MKKIDNFVRRAKKVRGDGYLDYFLWVDDGGSLYVQSCGNDKAGTYSDLLFAVSKYASVRNAVDSIGCPTGYILDGKVWVSKVSKNTNDSAFLKAVLRDLLP